ncbi:MAG: DUF1538 domain-containing protein [Clostridiales bacterium]|nr:DUF1538 domain-containing protein [Clostridiales bacterium]
MGAKRGNKLIRILDGKLKESCLSVLPAAGLVIILYLSPFVSLSFLELKTFLISTLFLVTGMALFNLGADLSMTPMGEHIGAGLTRSRRLKILLPVAFAMGLFITVAEPDLSVLAEQLSGVIGRTTLIITIGTGVGIFLLMGIIKIIFRIDLSSLLMFFYMLLFALVALLFERGKAGLLPLSFDSGGVTTGPVTVPFIMALGVGIAGTVGGKNAQENSFGLVSLCSIGPVLSMLVLSIFSTGETDFILPDYSVVTILNRGIGNAFAKTAGEIALAIGLIVSFFLILQITVLKLDRFSLMRIGAGIIYTFAGLVIFLTAAMIGYMPVGFKIGADLAGAAGGTPVCVLFTFIAGMATVLAEPAVHVLNHQVEEVTDGNVSKKQMMTALSIGVGISVGLSALRSVYGFSVLYYLIPGYVLSLALSLYVPGLYTAIAFDSGGVASGPLTSSFVLPLITGICVYTNGEQAVLESAFGVVAMVAMTPLIAIQILGFRALFLKRSRDKKAMQHIFSSEDEQIIYFDWDD